MDIALWIVAGLLAALYASAGSTKVRQPIEKLRGNPQLGWTNDFSPGMVKAIGVLEILGAIGLILPWALDLAAWLTPTAAVGLALLQLGAAVTHVRRKEYQVLPFNAVLLALAAFVAVGRF